MSKRNRKVNVKNQNEELVTVDLENEEKSGEENAEWKHVPEESRAKRFVKKIGSGVKKNGKKVAVVAAGAVAVGAAVIYELARSHSDKAEPSDYTGVIDANPVDSRDDSKGESEVIPFETTASDLEETGT